jgi:hypothetical protein
MCQRQRVRARARALLSARSSVYMLTCSGRPYPSLPFVLVLQGARYRYRESKIAYTSHVPLASWEGLFGASSHQCTILDKPLREGAAVQLAGDDRWANDNSLAMIDGYKYWTASLKLFKLYNRTTREARTCKA